jgi:two-component system NtrC family response regulator
VRTEGTILIVDDDPAVAASLCLVLKQARYRPVAVDSPGEALRRIEADDIGLVLQDMNFSRNTTGEEGIDLLREIRARRPALPVVLMTAWGSITLAVKGMRSGASDFITKPWTNQQILQTVRTGLELAAAAPEAAAEAPRTREELDARYDLRGIEGCHPRFLHVLDLAGRVAATDATVLITGESGTGKELIAEAIHRNSPRRAGSFVKVNLAGIPPTLFESEMFGHVRGAFTDARADRKGRFDLAAGGTIFLDEIGDLDPSAQAKLLRVLQDRTYEALGSSTTKTVDVRVVSATNRDLQGAAERGDFREDLLYRLNLISIHLPPLRERTPDIARGAARFLEGASRAYGVAPEGRLSESALRWLEAQPWPGNVRQLRHFIERTVLVSGRASLDVEDFGRAAAEPPAGPRRETLPEVGSMTMDEIERSMIEKSLRHHEGNITRAAEALGLSRAALYRRMQKYGIDA